LEPQLKLRNYEDDLIGPAPTNVGGPKSEKSNGGKYENFCHRQTDRRCWFQKDSRRVLTTTTNNKQQRDALNLQLHQTDIGGITKPGHVCVLRECDIKRL
jgi:hypothetical protein